VASDRVMILHMTHIIGHGFDKRDPSGNIICLLSVDWLEIERS